MSRMIDQLLNGSISPMVRFELRCEPVSMTLAMGGMAAMQAGTSIYGQFQARDAHNATEEYRRLEQENVIEENRRRATHDYITSTRLEREQQSQEEAAVAQQVVDISRQTDRTIATGMASAAERGIAGRTVDQIAQDFDFMANEETGRLKENQKLANQQHGEQIRSLGTEWTNRVTAVKPYVKTPAKPIDWFGPVFQVGAQTLNFAGAMPAGSLKGPGFGAQASGAPNPGTRFPSSIGVDPQYL
jgi:hypothetical protein